MSGKTQSPQALAHRFLIWATVAVFLVVTTGCGDAATPTAAPSVAPGPLPTETPTVAPTSTPVATPTPTEIPIVLPTATPPNPPLPPTENFFQVPFTSAPTSTPVPTSRPIPSATPYAPAIINILGVVETPITEVGYNRVDYVPPPNFTTQCLAAVSGRTFSAPTPTASVTPVSPSVPAVTAAPTAISYLGLANPDQWFKEFQLLWLQNDRINTVRIPAPTFTPIPTNTPVPTATPLPFNTPDVFTGLTPAPTEPPTATPRPIPPSPAPTWTPTIARKLQTRDTITLSSVFISDVTSTLPTYRTSGVNLTLMWKVMNDVTMAMLDPDTPLEVYLRAYESNLDTIVGNVVNISLKDPSLAADGSERYANRKVIIGNVPDLLAFRFFKPCFNDAQIRTVQNGYNNVIARVAAKYPGKVYIADLSALNWKGNPQWVSTTDGYRITNDGADAIADAFGRVFQKFLYSM
ncbi:MAG TPA: hypothetical protein VH186_19010 [Chloroflexia bacterium]|nr:hypothetical protein [Chloroflexia bacterium]